MNEMFVRLFLIELNKSGGMKAVYEKEPERIVISPKHAGFFSPLHVVYEDGEYLIRYVSKERQIMQIVKRIMGKVTAIMAAWEQSTPMCVEKFRKLLEWNGVMLAARDDGDQGLHLVTWRCYRDPQSVESGNYTTNISGAIWDFIGRSGLVPKERLFDDAQLYVIRSALSYRLGNDGNMLPDDEEKIKAILSALAESDD